MRNKRLRIFLYSLALFNLFCVVYLWWSGSGALFNRGTSESLIALGRLFGLFLEFGLLLQLVLISRIPWVEKGLGFPRANSIHRFIGKWIGIFLVLHPLFLSLGYGRGSGVSAWSQFISFLFNWEDVLNAFLGVLAFGFIIALTLWFRPKRYELWHFFHLVSYGGIALVFGHQTNSGDVSQGGPMWYWLALNFFVFGLLMLFRWLKPFILFYIHRFEVQGVKQESPDIWSVKITGRKMDKFRFEPGQYAYFIFLNKNFLEPHPFSFSSAPDGSTLKFSAKDLGDFTAKLKNLKQGTWVFIDGPLGNFTLDSAIKDKFLLIAGGIGITPIAALSEDVSRQSKDAVLLYSARTKNDFALQHQLPESIKKYFFVSEAEAPEGFESGRITPEKIRNLVPDFKDREVYICGPEEMILTLSKGLKDKGLRQGQLHSELFSY